MVRSLQGQAGLMVRENLQLHLVGGVGQELGGFGEGTALHAYAVDGENVVSYVQRPTSVGRRHGGMENPSLQNETLMFYRVRALRNYHYFQKLNVSRKITCRKYLSHVGSELEWKIFVEKVEKSEGMIFLIFLSLKIFCP